jgi:hypothetical protein
MGTVATVVGIVPRNDRSDEVTELPGCVNEPSADHIGVVGS